jgi:hypothetical protein
MRDNDLVRKMFYENHAQIKFIEQYYSDKIGYDVKIELTNASTSHFRKPYVCISMSNIVMFMRKDRALMRPMFYTLMMHEIGHAIYTDGLPFSMMANILEDNRIEHQINQWNARANFKFMRYLFQDEELSKLDPNDMMLNKQALSLALLRTARNEHYKTLIGYTKQRKQIIEEIMQLNDVYMNYDFKCAETPTHHINKMITIIDKVDKLIDELLDLKQKEEEQKRQQSNSNNNSNDEQDNSSDEQDNSSDEQSDETSNDEQSNETSNEQSSSDDDNQELEDAKTQLMQDAERLKSDEYYDVPIIFNPHGDTSEYDKYNINVFDTARRHGIKGTGNLQASSGNAKQLNMQRYMRKDIVKGEKLFDKQSNVSRGGQSAKVAFFIDVSGSMNGERIKIATDYLKSFYDAMNNHMEIRLFAFGDKTYKITRNELNLNFIEQNLQGSTHLNNVKLKPQEQMIVITDGQIDDDEMLQSVKDNARFVIITDSKNPDIRAFSQYKHKQFVRTSDISKGLEQATQNIKKYLKDY